MKNFIVACLMLFSAEALASDCRSYVARVKHPNGTFDDYDKIDKAINKAESGDKIYIGKDTVEEVTFNNSDNLTLLGECSNTIKSIKLQKSSNITIKDVVITHGKNNKACVQIVTNGNNYNEKIFFKNVQIKNCLSHGVSIEARNKKISFSDSRIENNAGYGIFKGIENGGAKPLEVELLNNIIANNNGTIVAGVSSKDLGNFAQILDNSDSGNQTTANNEGPGVGSNASSDLVAKTGPDQTLSPGEVAYLDGSASYTLSNKLLTYSWSFVMRPSGSTATILNSTTPKGSFTLDVAGNYTVELSVNDGEKIVKDQVIISTSNSRPVAIISPAQKITIGEEVTALADDSFDPDQSPLSYSWVLVKKPANSQTVLVNDNISEVSFNADLAGDYILELQTGDGSLLSKKVRRTFSTNNNAPIADAGDEQTSYRNINLTLEGNGIDPDNNTLSYEWKLIYSPSGANAILNNPASKNATFSANKNGLYILNLLVSDGVLKNAKTVVINLENRAPIVTIQPGPLKVEKGTVVPLVGIATDADNDTLTYQWSFVARPNGSNATISNAQSLNASFTADKGGTYVIKLQATDIFGEVAFDEITMKVSTRPVARLQISRTTGFIGEDIFFNGETSSDDDGDSLIYIYTLTNAPEGSVSDIIADQANSARAKINLTKVGSYTGTLVVSDGVLDSVPVSVNFTTAEKVNHPPVFSNADPQSVEVAQSLLVNMTATDQDNDKISYFMASSSPLKKNMSFNGETGAFTFKPSPDQVGPLTMTFVASDGKTTVEKTISITVTAQAPNIPTSFRGRVYDANSRFDGANTPIVGAVVSMMGSDAVSITDINGEFFLENIPLEANNFKIDSKNAQPAPDGSRYANFIELIHLVPNARNSESRPFYLPRIDSDAVAQVEPNKPTTVVNRELGVELKVPANGAVNPDGTPYTEELSISLVPKELAPVNLPEEFSPGMLITVQPSGVSFVEPVPISYPNIDKLPPGTETNIYQIDDSTGMFGVFGKGRVTDDGKRIETISGGLVNGSWGFVPPPPPIEPQDPHQPPCDPCGNSVQSGSETNLASGALYDNFPIVGYKSAGKERTFNLVYSSTSANPILTFNPISTLGNADSIPEYISTQLFIDGAKASEEIFMDVRNVSKAAGEKVQHQIIVDADHLKTGLYKHDILTSAHFASTTLRYRASDTPNYGGEFTVINNKDSAYGAGWTIDALKSLHIHESGNVMMINRGSAPVIFFLKPDGTYKQPHGTYYKLEKLTNSYRISNKEGTVFNFNSEGLLVSEVDRNLNETTYYYNSNKDLQSIEDPTGKKFKFIYNADNKLEQIVDPATRVTQLTYDGKGNLIKITNPDQSFREMNYDESHLLISKVNAPSGGFSRKKKANGIKELNTEIGLVRVTQYKYQMICGRTPMLSEVSFSTGEKVTSKAADQVNPLGCGDYTKAQPRPLYQPTKDSVTFTNKNGHTSKYDLDERGYIVRTFDPLNRLTQTLRDDRGNVTFEQDAENRVKQTLYDQKNNPTQITIGTGADSVRVRMTYDENFSKPLTIEEVGKGKTLFKLDSRGNVLISKDAQNTRTYYTYNNRGQVTSVTDSSKNTTALRYYPDGNLKEVEDPQGNKSQFIYDSAGNLTRTLDAKNQESVFVYDLMNRLKQVTNANNEVTKFNYDFKGNLTKVTDSRNQVTDFIYDSSDRVVQRTDPLGKSESFEYDFEGNLISHTDKKSRVIHYEYNAANELVKKILPDGKETEMSYDLAGNLKMIEDDFSKLTYTYDALNRVKTTSTDGAPYQPGVTLTNTYTNGNRTKLSTPFGVVDWVYDLQNRVKSITSFSGNQINYSYDGNGRRSQVQFPNGIVTKLAYDESSRLEKIAHQRNNVDVVSYSYEHDSNGNRTKMNVTSPITEALSQVNYTYDQVNQLIGATKTVNSSSDETFTYDNLGNRLKRNNQATNNIYDNNNRIVEDDKFTYAHDDNGNMIRKTNKQTGYTFKYVWDYENRLQFVTEHNQASQAAIKTHTFMYDAIGRRILKDSNGVTRKYIYDNEDILLEFNNADQLQAKFTHGPGIDEPIEMNRNNTAYFYHTDGLGSITSFTNLTGDVVQSYAYSSFGETKVYNSNGEIVTPELMIQSPYAYTGREWDYEIGLNYNRARYYDPYTGRFLSPDPIGFLGQDSNLYRYVFNNPIKWIDPMGLSPQDVYDMVSRFNKMMEQMNNAGVRISPGELNNLMASLNAVSFGKLGKDYLGCGEQASFVAQNLEGLKFEDKWTFVVKNEYFVDGQFHHQWIEAVSSNPNDPVLKIDPWNSSFTPK